MRGSSNSFLRTAGHFLRERKYDFNGAYICKMCSTAGSMDNDDRLLYRLQRVQNTAARLVSCIRKSAHITPILMKLHWLPVHYRLKFKILLQMYKVVNGSSPSYLANLVSKHVPSRYLRSSDANLFVVPRTFSKFGDRRFSVCGPLLWNNLPTDIKCAETLNQFKSLLKTFFYTEAFDT